MRGEHEQLRDILDAVEQIEVEHAKGKRAFKNSRLIQVWMLHHLMIIGEAVRYIDPALKRAHPAIPWKLIAGMRNVIVHDYFRVDNDIVWRAVDKDVPALKHEIEKILEQNVRPKKLSPKKRAL